MTSPLDLAQTQWQQDSLLSGGCQACYLEVSWFLEGSRAKCMVGYELRTSGKKNGLLAAGLTWVQDWSDPAQWHEVQADLFKIAREQLSPF